MVQKCFIQFWLWDPSTQCSDSDMKELMFFFFFFNMSEDEYCIACLKSAVIKD